VDAVVFIGNANAIVRGNLRSLFLQQERVLHGWPGASAGARGR
jgi:hypothetical protein